MSIDWPEGVIGAFKRTDGGGGLFFVKTKGVSNYQGKLGFEGVKLDGDEYHVLSKYWEWCEPAVWNGEGLPPVGACVILSAGDFNVFPGYLVMMDALVKVEAVFKSPTGLDMIACSMPDGLCGCFRASMAKPAPTPEQIAEEEREKAINEMVDDIGKFFSNPRVSARTIYDAGYRKQEAQ